MGWGAHPIVTCLEGICAWGIDSCEKNSRSVVVVLLHPIRREGWVVVVAPSVDEPAVKPRWIARGIEIVETFSKDANFVPTFDIYDDRGLKLILLVRYQK